MLSVVPILENTEQAMTLTNDYLDLNESDVYVYFTSSLFGTNAIINAEPFSGWHGQTLAHWIRDKAIVGGYQLSEPANQLTSWTMELELENSTWNIVCENLKYNSTDRWKVSITNLSLAPTKTTNSVRELCLEFCYFCSDLFRNTNHIQRVEWNIAELNTNERTAGELVY